jgi:hypothetical protein
MARPPQNASPFSQKLAAAATARGSPSRASRDFALQNRPPGTEPENRFRPQWLNQTHKQHAADPHQRLQRQPFPRAFRPDQRRLLHQQLSFASHPETSTRYPPVSLSFIVVECISALLAFLRANDLAPRISARPLQQPGQRPHPKNVQQRRLSQQGRALQKSKLCRSRILCAPETRPRRTSRLTPVRSGI